VRQPELTSLIGLRDSDGDQLHLVRLDRANGSRRYVMTIGQERVFLTPGDLERLSTVIRCEVGGRNDDLKAAFRFLAHAIWLLIFCAVLSLLASALKSFGEWSPILRPKALATADWMSGGRIMVTFGVGWLKPEFDLLGVRARVLA